MEFFPDEDHMWWPIAVKREETHKGHPVESTVLSVCRDPECGVFGTQRLLGDLELYQIQQMTLCIDALELTQIMDGESPRKRWNCRVNEIIKPAGQS